MLKKILIALGIIIVGIQFIPVDRSNPPVTQEIDAPANVKSILETSCYDCHSNKTNWPWYSYVAPVSFLVAGDVNEGREHLNFSEWDRYDGKKRAKILEEILEEVEKGKMPLSQYTMAHPEAEMDRSKIASLKDWIISPGNSEGHLRYQKNNEQD
jgi:hypothetical protein